MIVLTVLYEISKINVSIHATVCNYHWREPNKCRVEWIRVSDWFFDVARKVSAFKFAAIELVSFQPSYFLLLESNRKSVSLPRMRRTKFWSPDAGWRRSGETRTSRGTPAISGGWGWSASPTTGCGSPMLSFITSENCKYSHSLWVL